MSNTRPKRIRTAAFKVVDPENVSSATLPSHQDAADQAKQAAHTAPSKPALSDNTKTNSALALEKSPSVLCGEQDAGERDATTVQCISSHTSSEVESDVWSKRTSKHLLAFDWFFLHVLIIFLPLNHRKKKGFQALYQ
jgi:hypothetical protein